MKYSIGALILFLQAICLAPHSNCQVSNPDSATGQTLSILNDKYFLRFPTGSKNIPRVADIMAADPNKNRETRVVYENGNHKLVFFAQELNALAGNNLFQDVSGAVEPEFDFKRQIITDNDSVLAILSTPQRYDTTTDAILVNSLLVKSPDNTISRIDAYISPSAFTQKETYKWMSDGVFRTITKGPRRVNLNPKSENYKITGTNASFDFRLPQDYFVTVDEKYDFVVFKINKFRKNINDTTYAGISIYAGHHPNFFHADYGYKFQQAVKANGKFVDLPVDWMFFKDDAQSFYLKEQIVPVDEVEKGLVFHVSMLSNKKSVLDELNKIVESVKLKR